MEDHFCGAYVPGDDEDSNQAFCSGEKDSCEIDCDYDANGNIKGVTRSYGALAFSYGSGDSGWAAQYSTQAAAEKAAISACADGSHHAHDCKSVTWFYNNCGALASSPDHDAGWSYAASAKAAQNQALAYCDKQSGKNNCSVIISRCSK